MPPSKIRQSFTLWPLTSLPVRKHRHTFLLNILLQQLAKCIKIIIQIVNSVLKMDICEDKIRKSLANLNVAVKSSEITRILKEKVNFDFHNAHGKENNFISR